MLTTVLTTFFLAQNSKVFPEVIKIHKMTQFPKVKEETFRLPSARIFFSNGNNRIIPVIVSNNFLYKILLLNFALICNTFLFFFYTNANRQTEKFPFVSHITHKHTKYSHSSWIKHLSSCSVCANTHSNILSTETFLILFPSHIYGMMWLEYINNSIKFVRKPTTTKKARNW